MKAWLALLRSFILRGLRREPARALLTIAGIAVGVAVAMAIRLGNRSALESFRQGTEAVAGETSLEIAGPLGRFDETLASELWWLRDHGAASPVVEGWAWLADTGSGSASASESDSLAVADAVAPQGRYLRLLGVDLLLDRPVRDYRLVRFAAEGREPSGRELLELLDDPRAIILTETLARERGLDVGGEIELLIDDRSLSFRIRGLLLDEGPARSLGGYFALLDIAAAQEALDRHGQLDRLDVKLRPGLDPEAAYREIAPRLPAGLVARDPARRYQQVETMIESFHFNLSALGSLALLVGLYLVYNSASFSVLRRRREIGRLRAIGASRRLILGLFLGEALLLALPGTALGLLLGQLLARGTVEATATTVSTFYVAETARASAATLAPSALEVLGAFLVVVPLALLAAAWPASEATRVPPAETGRSGGETPRPPRRGVLYAIAALLALAYLCSLAPRVGELPLFAYLAVLALLAAASLAVPLSLGLACRTCEALLGSTRGLGTESLLAASQLRASTTRVSISVAALAVSLAMTVSIAIMIGSFRRTVVDWLEESLSADIFVRPASMASSLVEGAISDEARGILEADPAVVASERLYRRSIEFEGRPITLGARDLDALLAHGHLSMKRGGREAIARARRKGQALVSESFAYLFARDVGDTIVIPSPGGPRSLEIAGIFYDYSNNRGVVLLDVAPWAEHFASQGELERPSHVALHLAEGSEAAKVAQRLRRAAGREHRLVIHTNEGVLEGSLAIFDSTFAITYALQFIAVLVAALGVISTLLALLQERRREIALLNLVGASRAQIRKTICLEAGLIGLTSQLLGLVTGVLLSLVLIYVVNVQSFGWTIRLHLPWLYFAQATLFTVLAATVAGLYPARRATRRAATFFATETS